MENTLKPSQLKRSFDIDTLGIKDTENLDHLTGIIGQERAVKALQFGLHIKGIGYNTYVAGSPGIGKMTSVKSYIEKLAREKEVPNDWCYVNNFADSYNPNAIHLPAGKGNELKQDMEHFIDHIRGQLPKSFESDEYSARKEEILKELSKKKENISTEIHNLATRQGFSIQPSPFGILIVPVKDGKTLKENEFQQLPESEQEDYQKRKESLQEDIKKAMKEMRKLENHSQKKIRELDQNVALNVVGGTIEDLIEKYKAFPKIVSYLKNVQKDILDNLDAFKMNSDQKNQNVKNPQLKQQQEMMEELAFRKYRVNVVVDNSQQKGAPVIVEYNPTYNNLIGRIEKEMQMGVLTTDFTIIRAGSILRANGGFLVLPVEDVLRNLYSYDGIKRTLRSGKIYIEEMSERLGFMTVKTLRPEAIEVDLKVVLVGSPLIYYLLQAYDEDFKELFKVKADFDTSMDINEINIRDFMSFISTYCHREELKHLDSAAIVRFLEHAVRVAGDQNKLSIKFGLLSDVIREADFYAQQDDATLIKEEHIQKALDEKIYRANLIQTKIQEMIERDTLLIDTKDQKVGQVNGLTVIDLGDYHFGKPTRITATVSPGQEGIMDIEREVKLGGPIHSKGVLILSGYLTKKYQNNRPLSLSAKLVFEQSYQGVEGDSASSAELYALLSALSNIPLRQEIAVTGSVNQNGEIQAIGGVNEKIEGFFDICNAKGLTGNQGVIIPNSNRKNLMLQERVITAVEQEKFHIWGINTIDEGINILTQVPAGEREADGTYPQDSVNERVSVCLQNFESVMQKLANIRKTE